MDKYKKGSIQDWILFYIDTGISYDGILKLLVGNPMYEASFDLDCAKQALDGMIHDKTLACGPKYGWDRWLVVREWMPRTAEELES